MPNLKRKRMKKCKKVTLGRNQTLFSRDGNHGRNRTLVSRLSPGALTTELQD